MELPKNSETDHPWQWEESRWRSIVTKVRAGRSLKPAEWKVQISARLYAFLQNAVERYWGSRATVMNHFIEEGLYDRLKELEDIQDLKQTRHELTRPLTELLAELQLNGDTCDRDFSEC